MRNHTSDMRTMKTEISLYINSVWSAFSLSTWKEFTSLGIQNVPVMILIRLQESEGWSELSLGARLKVCFLVLQLKHIEQKNLNVSEGINSWNCFGFVTGLSGCIETSGIGDGPYRHEQ